MNIDYTSLLFRSSLISYLRSLTAVKDTQYRNVTDEIIFSLENKVPLKNNSLYEEFYRKFKFKLLSVHSATAGLQFALYKYDFGKSINKIVGKVETLETLDAVFRTESRWDGKTPIITSFSPYTSFKVNDLSSQLCIDQATVDIYGENLYPVTSVKVNGFELPQDNLPYIQYPDGKRITIYIWNGSTTGKITVTTPNGTTTSTEILSVDSLCV